MPLPATRHRVGHGLHGRRARLGPRDDGVKIRVRSELKVLWAVERRAQRGAQHRARVTARRDTRDGVRTAVHRAETQTERRGRRALIYVSEHKYFTL